MYRYDFAPRLLHLAGLGATHATELFAVFGRRGVGVRTLTALGGRKGLRAVTETMQRHWLRVRPLRPPAGLVAAVLVRAPRYLDHRRGLSGGVRPGAPPPGGMARIPAPSLDLEWVTVASCNQISGCGRPRWRCANCVWAVTAGPRSSLGSHSSADRATSCTRCRSSSSTPTERSGERRGRRDQHGARQRTAPPPHLPCRRPGAVVRRSMGRRRARAARPRDQLARAGRAALLPSPTPPISCRSRS